MAINDAFAATANGLADTGDLIIDGSASGTGAVELQEFSGTASCKVYKEFDPDGDSTYEITVTVDSFSGQFHSQLNAIQVSGSQNMRVRIRNDSGNTNDYAANGIEVDN